jgi:uncharacterized membrane protein
MNTLARDNIEWSEVLLLAFVYALFVLVVTSPIGFAISAYKVYRFKNLAEHSTGPLAHETVLIATHHEWLVRTFIFMVVLTMAAAGTFYYFFGFVFAAIAVAWWFYRLIRGIKALVAYQNMPAAICTRAQCYGEVTRI